MAKACAHLCHQRRHLLMLVAVMNLVNSGLVVRKLNLRSKGHEFDSCSGGQVVITSTRMADCL